jgi:hypothetical protein
MYRIEDHEPSFRHGKQYKLTIKAKNKRYHKQFHDCVLVYWFRDHEGVIHQSSWPMVKCTKGNWAAGDKTIKVVFMATNPRNAKTGSRRVSMSGLKLFWEWIVRWLTFTPKATAPAGNGGVYGSNDHPSKSVARAAVPLGVPIVSTPGPPHQARETWLIRHKGGKSTISIEEK